MKDNANLLIREVKQAASLYLAAKASGDYKKLRLAVEKLTEMLQNYLDGGGSLDELSLTLAGGQGKKE